MTVSYFKYRITVNEYATKLTYLERNHTLTELQVILH